MKKYTKYYDTPYQVKMPLEISEIIEISDPVYTFNEIVSHIDLRRYFAGKGSRMGRPRCDAYKMLKIILFAFMEGGYESLRDLEKRCKTDIRYIWMLDGMKAPSFSSFGNFIRNELTEKIEQIFLDINEYIFETEGVDMNHVYIDGTKIEANANRYTWVWKKSCITSRGKVFKMEKYMKFTMFEKTVKDAKYRDDPFRAVNFGKADDGSLVCPNGKKFVHLKDKPISGNKYGRTEELYVCESCDGCTLRSQCCKKKTGNRVVQLNRELTSMYEEVLNNLESIHGALLRMKRSIQAEGTFGIMKWDRRYKRAFPRGLTSVILEFTLISCGFNLYKYHNKRWKLAESA